MPQLRGLPTDDVDVRLSKTLAYLLRHGADKSDLPIRTDGFVKVSDLLSDPMLSSAGLSQNKLMDLVRDNAKKRFVLFYGVDPTPLEHQPRRKTGQSGKGKGKGTGKESASGMTTNGEGSTSQIKPNPTQQLPLIPFEPATSYDPLASTLGGDEGNPQATSSTSSPPQYFIRAAQGHSLPDLQPEAHLETIALENEIDLERVGEMVHGTKWENWDAILSTGLSRMTRHHIHLSPSPTHPSCRQNSTLLIYLSPSALNKHTPPIPVFLSTNGVVLTPGDEQGFIGREMWEKVIRVRRERVTAEIKNGQEVDVNQVGKILERALLEAGGENDGDGAVRANAHDGQEEKAAKRKEAKQRRKGNKDNSDWKVWKEVIWEKGQSIDPPRMVDA